MKNKIIKTAALYPGQLVALSGDRDPSIVVARTGKGEYTVNRKGIEINGVHRTQIGVRVFNCGYYTYQFGPINEKLSAARLQDA